jgi:dipeptidyl aminopeptidase/acylaminoacyl peptidase
LVDIGIADSTRLGLIGHSYGGYTVYSILTQTHRYKTAIAAAGASDLISFYSEFDGYNRYTNPNLAVLFGPMYSETLQMRMGVPPWVDPERYVRNSPLLQAHKIDTPLLIIEGARDGSMNTQNEEMYTALYRLGRRAEFLSYLREGHGIEAPADVIDVWQRMFGWLDRYLAPSPTDRASDASSR